VTLKIVKPDDGRNEQRRRRGSMQIYEAMREDILWMRLKPGQALDEVAIAKQFEISRTPVREALLMLAGEDLVVFLPNRTSIIAPHLLDNLDEYIDTYLILARSVARAAAIKRTDDDLAAIRAALDTCISKTEEGDHSAILKADLDLHRLFARAAHNDFSRKFHDMALDYGRRARILHYFPHAGRKELEHSNIQHRQLVDAIEAGNADRADAVMREHIATELDVIIASLKPVIGLDMPLGVPENREKS
jgi:DNA-binding GntR family transcriptional regulator